MSSIGNMDQRRYHHGDLRRAVLDGALAAIADRGAAAFSLRDVARRAGVSHAAPAHHFGDKTGVLTAIATEGFELLAAATDAASSDLIDGGLAYIRFAIEHPAHYEVMFRPDLYNPDDVDLINARRAGSSVLFNAVRRVLGPDASDEAVVGGVVAAWSFAHGFASLWSAGNIPAPAGSAPEDLARQSASAFVQLVTARAKRDEG